MPGEKHPIASSNATLSGVPRKSPAEAGPFRLAVLAALVLAALATLLAALAGLLRLLAGILLAALILAALAALVLLTHVFPPLGCVHRTAC